MKVILMNKKMKKFNYNFKNKLKNKIDYKVNNFKKIYYKKYKMMKIPTFELLNIFIMYFIINKNKMEVSEYFTTYD
jgi:hypothetical protein